jgi:hypothetical protein
MSILNKITNIIEIGLKEKTLQKTPHLVLLDRFFYHQQLRPLLAQWLMLFLSTKRLTGITEQQAMTYLMNGPKGDPAVVDAVNRLLTTEYVKLVRNRNIL